MVIGALRAVTCASIGRLKPQRACVLDAPLEEADHRAADRALNRSQPVGLVMIEAR